jgi:hypothetical protein
MEETMAELKTARRMRALGGLPLSPRWPVKATARTRTEISEASARRMKLTQQVRLVNSPLGGDDV